MSCLAEHTSPEETVTIVLSGEVSGHDIIIMLLFVY
jgi:hypothetical protein